MIRPLVSIFFERRTLVTGSRYRLLLTRLLVVVASSLAALGIGVSGAAATLPPPPGGGHCSANCWANHIVFLDDTPNGLGFYNYAKSTPSLHSHFNWGFDGCSVPSWVYKALAPVGLDDNVATYSKFFRPSCRIHDFGYRNFGKGSYRVTAGDSSDPRKSVDDRFDALMHKRCNANPPAVSYAPDKWACNRVAGVFYEAVRKFGASHW